MEEKINLRFTVICCLILFAAFSRIIPHMPNFSPLGAIALFGAAYFANRWQAFLIPLLATWLSDLFINNVIYSKYYPSFTWFDQGFYWQYGSYLLITLAGIFILRKITIKRIIAASLASTAIFFLVSSVGCFPGNPDYPGNFSGLMSCYEAGIPFLGGTFLGDLFYVTVLFGGFAILANGFPELRLDRQMVGSKDDGLAVSSAKRYK